MSNFSVVSENESAECKSFKRALFLFRIFAKTKEFVILSRMRDNVELVRYNKDTP